MFSSIKRLRSPFIMLAALAVVGVGCSPSIRPAPVSSKPVTLTYWSVTDDFDAFDDIVKAYRAVHPNVTLEYRKFRVEEYEKELINALAEDRGPDIMSLHNTWIRSYQTKLAPLPPRLRLAFRELQGTLQKKPVWVEKIVTPMTINKLKNTFVDQVARDAVIAAPIEGERNLTEQIFGLPLSLDTMALYFNRDVMNAAGIPTPPTSWNEFSDHVKRATRYDSQGKLIRPVAGIGTSNNVERYFDILSLLMIQNRTQMTDANGFPIFNKIPPGNVSEIAPGLQALIYYTDFANPEKEVFTWDDTQPNSFDAFISGKTAYFFGYSYHNEKIKARAPKLNFGVTTIPQVSSEPDQVKNYANYWLETVSKKSENKDIAWDFIQFMTKEDNVKSYLTKTVKPTALRGLVNTQLGEADVSIFASQVLTAKSWYQGKNIQATEKAFADLIKAVQNGEDPRKAISRAVDVVGQTLR